MVNFLKPIEVDELSTMNTSVNYVGTSSWIIGIRVESENIQAGTVNHCNSSYFTIVSKDKNGKNTSVPAPILSNLKEVSHFKNCLKQIDLKKERDNRRSSATFESIETILSLLQYDVKVDLQG